MHHPNLTLSCSDFLSSSVVLLLRAPLENKKRYIIRPDATLPFTESGSRSVQIECWDNFGQDSGQIKFDLPGE